MVLFWHGVYAETMVLLWNGGSMKRKKGVVLWLRIGCKAFALDEWEVRSYTMNLLGFTWVNVVVVVVVVFANIWGKMSLDHMVIDKVR